MIARVLAQLLSFLFTARHQQRAAGGGGYYVAEWSMPDGEEALRDALRQRDYPLPAALPPTQGGGGFVKVGERWLIGGEGGGTGRDASGERGTLRLGAGRGAFQVGYVLLDLGVVRVFPLFGVSGSGVGGVVFPPGADPKRYQVRPGDPVFGVGISSFQVGIGVDLKVRLSERFSPFLGVRAGFSFGTVTSGPTNDKMPQMFTIPTRPTSGPFFRVVLGGESPRGADSTD